MSQPEEAKKLMAEAQHDATMRYSFYKQLASLNYGEEEKKDEAPAGATK
jgi:hypothetical protein